MASPITYADPITPTAAIVMCQRALALTHLWILPTALEQVAEVMPGGLEFTATIFGVSIVKASMGFGAYSAVWRTGRLMMVVRPAPVWLQSSLPYFLDGKRL